jgi:hypothetical protein
LLSNIYLFLRSFSDQVLHDGVTGQIMRYALSETGGVYCVVVNASSLPIEVTVDARNSVNLRSSRATAAFDGMRTVDTIPARHAMLVSCLQGSPYNGYQFASSLTFRQKAPPVVSMISSLFGRGGRGSGRKHANAGAQSPRLIDGVFDVHAPLALTEMRFDSK